MKLLHVSLFFISIWLIRSGHVLFSGSFCLMKTKNGTRKTHAIKIHNLSITDCISPLRQLHHGDHSTNLVIKFNCIDADGDIDAHYVDLNRLITAETRNRCSFYEVSLRIGQVEPFGKFDCCNSTRYQRKRHFAHTTSTCRSVLLIIRNVPDLSVTLQHKSNV